MILWGSATNVSHGHLQARTNNAAEVAGNFDVDGDGDGDEMPFRRRRRIP